MELKFKKLNENAITPTRSHNTDAGLDFYTIGFDTVVNEAREMLLVYHTGIAVEIPEGYVGLLFSRSSVFKKSLIQSNCVGVIDAGYRGELMVTFRTTTTSVPEIYKQGDKCFQLVIVPIPTIELIEAEELNDSERGVGGFGSTGDNVNSGEVGDVSDTEQETKID